MKRDALVGFVIAATSVEAEANPLPRGTFATDILGSFLARVLGLLLVVSSGVGCAEAIDEAASTESDLTSGLLDTTFGQDGKLLTEFERSKDIAFDPTSRLALAFPASREDFFFELLPTGETLVSYAHRIPRPIPSFADETYRVVAKVSAAGKLDPAFGTDGVYVTPIEHPTEHRSWGGKFIVHSDGSFLVAGKYMSCCGTHSFGVEITKHGPNGAIDASWGTNGSATTSFRLGAFEIDDFIETTEGKLIVVATSADGVGTAIGVARFDQDGRIDNSFYGSGGRAFGRSLGQALLRTAKDWGDKARAATVLSDGSIVVVGYGGSPRDLEVLKLLPNGWADPTFGVDGAYVAPKPAVAAVRNEFFPIGIIVQPDGGFLIPGTRSVINQYQSALAVVRLTSNGQLDTSFGDGGLLLPAMPPKMDVIWSLDTKILVRDDGRFFIGGAVSTIPGWNQRTPSDFGIFAFRADGTLDTSFGSKGWVTTDIGGRRDGITAMTITPAGRLLVAGYAEDPALGPLKSYPTAGRLALARYSLDP